MNALSIFNEGIMDGNKLQFVEIIETGISSELASIAIIISGLIVGFSREKN